MDKNQLWKNIIKELSKLTNKEFNIKNAKLNIENNLIKIIVNNKLNLRYLKSKNKLIKKIIKDLTDKDYNIEFILSQKKDQTRIIEFPENNIQKEKNKKPMLNEKFTFETFVVGPSNEMAFASAKAVADSPAKAYNPLFIYGGVGLGKTHLMHAIGHKILNNYPALKIMYLSTEKFTNELIMAIQNKNTEQFREKYRSIDVLLIDDIQFLSGKERTQEEFFHTFNELYNSNKQIVISSDRTPRNIPTLEDRLRSRFEGGLIVDIQKPELETREAILRKKAQLENIKVSDDIIHFIAVNIDSNIRELEGALTRIKAVMQVKNKQLTLEEVEEMLQPFINKRGYKKLDANTIIEAVSKYLNVDTKDIMSSRRDKKISYARQLSMYLIRELTDESLKSIGAFFGGKDHSTVIHSINKIEKKLSTIEVKEDVENLYKILKVNRNV